MSVLFSNLCKVKTSFRALYFYWLRISHANPSGFDPQHSPGQFRQMQAVFYSHHLCLNAASKPGHTLTKSPPTYGSCNEQKMMGQDHLSPFQIQVINPLTRVNWVSSNNKYMVGTQGTQAEYFSLWWLE